jgi:hypothetical protein
MVGRDSVVGRAVRYGVDGLRIESRWGGAERDFSAPVRTDSRAHPMGTGSFPRLRRPGRDEHLPPSGAEVKERVQVYFYTPAESSQTVLGWIIALPLRKELVTKVNRSTYGRGYVSVTDTAATGYGLNLISHPQPAAISHMKKQL